MSKDLSIKTIIFDIGGVFTHTDFQPIYTGFAKRIGVPPDFVVDYHKTNMESLLLGNITLEQFWADMRKAGADPNLDYATIWVEDGIKNREVNTELLEIVGKLKKQYLVGVLTNLTPSRVLIDKAIGLYPYFDYVVLSCEEHIKKPDPKFYEIALMRASAKPEEAVFVDDKEKCTLGAEAVGIKGVLYTYPDNAKLLEDFDRLGISVRFGI